MISRTRTDPNSQTSTSAVRSSASRDVRFNASNRRHTALSVASRAWPSSPQIAPVRASLRLSSLVVSCVARIARIGAHLTINHRVLCRKPPVSLAFLCAYVEQPRRGTQAGHIRAHLSPLSPLRLNARVCASLDGHHGCASRIRRHARASIRMLHHAPKDPRHPCLAPEKSSRAARPAELKISRPLFQISSPYRGNPS
jgi:hypothetical protein